MRKNEFYKLKMENGKLGKKKEQRGKREKLAFVVRFFRRRVRLLSHQQEANAVGWGFYPDSVNHKLNCAKPSFFGLPCRPARGLLAWDARCGNFFSRFTFHLSHKKSNDGSKLFPLSSSLFPNNAPHPDFLMFGEPHIENRPQPLKGGGYAPKPKNKLFNLSTHRLINFFSHLTSHFSPKKSNDGSKLFPFPSSLFPKSKPKLAFTLAEVLIVLGIIGAIAAMTLPPLIQKTQDAEMINKMKKEYSVLQQAYLQIAIDNGGSFLIAVSGTTDSTFKNLFKNKLRYINDCDSNAFAGGCFNTQSNIKFLSGDAVPNNNWVYDSQPGIVLQDGTTMEFGLDTGSCNNSFYTPYVNECGWVTIDVNGLQGPNTFGRDIYIFIIFADTIRANFRNKSGIYDDCIKGDRGQTCASKYLYSK